ncbi:MAG: flippase [Candidatus Aminicenantes bacterium]|nr:flippase [Candidatus Aminicenantes bacterium]
MNYSKEDEGGGEKKSGDEKRITGMLPDITKKKLGKNTLYNLAGYIFPLTTALLVVPTIIKMMGTARFGILTIIWVLIGYVSIFDLGMGRALTYRLSQNLASKENERNNPSLIWTSIITLFSLGVFVGALGFVCSKPAVALIFKLPESLQAEVLQSLRILCAAVPFVLIVTGLKGILHAYQRFDLMNMIQIPSGILNFLGPLIILHWSHRVTAVILVLFAVRLLMFSAYTVSAIRLIPSLLSRFFFKKTHFFELFRFGRWVTISSVISPILVYIDRFVISALTRVNSIAYYTVPLEMVGRIWIFPYSIGNVLFPVFSSLNIFDKKRAERMFISGIKYTFIIIVPLVFFIFVFAEDGLRLWLGFDFAQNSTPILRWILAGILVNCPAMIILTYIHGAGKPALPAFIHLIELPLYIGSLYWMVRFLGIEGAAVTWFGRVTLDAFVLFFIAVKLLKLNTASVLKMLGITFSVYILLLPPLWMNSLIMKGVYSLCILVFFAYFIWIFFLSFEEKKWIRNLLKRGKGIKRNDA